MGLAPCRPLCLRYRNLSQKSSEIFRLQAIGFIGQMANLQPQAEACATTVLDTASKVRATWLFPGQEIGRGDDRKLWHLVVDLAHFEIVYQ
jgi:hypothetical protein